MKFLLFIFLLFTSTFYAQQKVIAKFIITDAKKNGIDETPYLLKAGAVTVFYTADNDGLLYMANVFTKDNTQSFGPIYSSQSTKNAESNSSFKTDVATFNWHYINDYNDKSGTAKVKFTKIYKPQGIAFELRIIPENLDLIVYKGYMEGTIDFSDYE